jgi:CBS domain-containing protein
MDILSMLVSRTVESIPHDTVLQSAAGVMKNKKIGSLLVEKGGETVGIVSETDIARRAVAEGLDPRTTAIEAIMSHPVITIGIDATPEMANDLMKEKGIRHLAVTENGAIVGVVSVRDLLRYFKVYYDGIGSLRQK